MPKISKLERKKKIKKVEKSLPRKRGRPPKAKTPIVVVAAIEEIIAVAEENPVAEIAKTEEIPKKDKNYFGKETENWIVKFQQEQDTRKRNDIFVKNVKPAFDKLIENLVNVYKFHTMGDVEVMRHDCMTFLFENLYKFDSTKGFKAFSYFNVIAKNWFILRVKTQKKKNSVFSQSEDCVEEIIDSDESKHVQSYDNNVTNVEFYEYLKEDMTYWESKLRKPHEKKVYDAVCLLINSVDSIDIYNKKTILLYIRDITGLNTKQVVNNFTKMRRKYNLFKNRFLEGDI